MTLQKHRIGLAGAPYHHQVRRQSNGCATGGFYKSPSSGQTVQAGQPFNISWDTSCMSTDAVDIFLYNPASSNPRIHMWENVNFALGSYETTLRPQWWNSSSSASLQFNIIPHGQPPFMAELPAGPLFTATYSADTSGALEDASDSGRTTVEQVNNFEKDEGLPKGKIAAAVIMPLLVVIAIIVGIYIKISRKKGKEHRKQWTEAVDKRMSTISTDWKSMSAAGATAAIRHSIAVSAEGNRSSSFSFGAIRPSSTVAVESGQAGIGAKGLQGGIDTTTPQMSQLRTGLRNPIASGERVSRISFAADTRPSADSRRSIYSRNSRATSRAFHNGYVPPLPQRQDSNDLLSPTQTAGPLSLTADDIHARMAGVESPPRPSVDGIFPALSMMRTGIEGPSGNDELLFEAPKSPISPPPQAHSHQPASVVGMMPMQPMPASVMSPDDMLRAYAERRGGVASPPPTGNGPSMPVPVHYNGNGMRVLYEPATPNTPNSSAALMMPQSDGSKYDDNDAYVGTAA